MPLVLDGTNGVSGVDGTASNPAIEGTDSNTGIFYPAADTVAIGTGGTERLRVDSAGNVGLGVTPSAWSTGSSVRAFQNPAGGLWNFGTNYQFLGQNYYFNSSNQRIYLTTAAASEYAQVSGQHQWFNAASGTAGNAITFTQAMTLDASGNLGIGTTSPSFASGMGIAINGGAGQARLVLKNNNTGDASTDGLQIGVATDSSAFIEQRENSHLFFATNAIERARITSGGDFLVGTSSSGGKITVNDGNVHINWGGGYFNSLDRGMTIVAGGYNDTTNKARVVHVGGIGDNNNRCGWTAYGIKTAGTGNGSQYYLRPVTWTGSAFAEQGSAGVYLADNATSWTSASDERLKDIIEPITDAANKVASLRAVIGKYKTDDEGTRRTFLIAQDVQAVLPEAVKAQEDEQCTLGLAYTDTIPLLVAAIKEQQAMIDELKAKVAALENA